MEFDSKPLVLLSNDDGYASPGIVAMREALLTFADVVLVAPETEQSAASHSISLHRPLRLRSLAPNMHAVDGTPADSVYVALNAGTRLLPRWPDLVVSGINRGLNLGQDVFYSGTVAAAREAALRGIPSVAISAHESIELASVASFTGRLVAQVLKRRREGDSSLLLNVNVPPGWSGKVVSAKLGSRIYEQEVDFRMDPRGREYLWIGGSDVRHGDAPDSDTNAYDAGVASVTPLVLDLTASATMEFAREIADALGASDRLPRG